MPKISIISKHLHAALRLMDEQGDSAISHQDLLDLVLAELVTLKVGRGWTISAAGREYLSANLKVPSDKNSSSIIPLDAP